MIEFRTLGPVGVTVDGVPIDLVGRRQRAALAGLLLSPGRCSSVPGLAGAIWGDSPPRTAQKQVRNAVSAVRALLAPTPASIEVTAHGYHLNLGGSWLDLDEFREQLGAAELLRSGNRTEPAVVAYRAALSTWTSTSFEEMRGIAHESRTTALLELRLAAFESCAELELQLGRHSALIPTLWDWHAENPLRERLVGLLMEALFRVGSRDRALWLYHEHGMRLRDSLGVAPGAALRQTHQQILRDVRDPAVA